MLADLYISLHASGAEYRPSKMDFRFSTQHDPAAIAGFGIHKGEPWAYGYSAIEVPSSVPLGHKIDHLCSTAAPLISGMRAAGADDIYVKLIFVCESGLDFPIESAELKALSELGCLVSVSCEAAEEENGRANRVAGEVSLPGPHTTRRTGPYRAVPKGRE